VLADGLLTLQWTILPDANGNSAEDRINLTFTGRTTGWVGLGFPSTPGFMLGSDAIIGWVTSNGTVTVGDYYITQRVPACPGVCPDNQQRGQNNIESFTGFEADGHTTLSVIRKLVTNDTKFDKPISLTEDTNIVFAVGFSDTLAYHGPNRAAATINFGSGKAQAASVNTGSKTDRRWHGSLMFVAFFVLFPIGIFIAAYLKPIGVWWFRLHVLIQIIAILVAYAGFITIVQWTSKQQLEHFRATHQRLGLTIIILVTITPFLGMLADMLWKPDRKGRPLFPDYTHWLFGYVTVLLAWINVYLGLKKIGDTDAWVWALVSVWMGLVFLLYLIFMFIRLGKGDQMCFPEKKKAVPTNNGQQEPLQQQS
jgi:hypothetical protein